MTKRVKRKIATLLLATQFFFNFFLPLSPLIESAVAASSPLQFSVADSTLTVNNQLDQEIDYSYYYLHQGVLQNAQGILTPKAANALFIGIQSDDDFIKHDWQQLVFKTKQDDAVTAYYLYKDGQNAAIEQEQKASDLKLDADEASWLQWQINEDKQQAVTNGSVVVGTEYVFPLDDRVSVTFTSLSEEADRSPLTIRQINLDEELAAKYGTDVAFDITTEMKDGEFEFDLSLPGMKKEDGTDANEDEIEVVYAETEDELEDEAAKPNKVEKEKDGEKVVEVVDQGEESKVKVKKLDHMTVFVVVNVGDSSDDPNDCEKVWVGGDQCFDTIQEAIDEAVGGETIYVGEGTYIEEGQIIIDKDLTIIGEGKEKTIIKPSSDTPSTHLDPDSGWFVVKNNSEFNLSDVTLDGEGKTVLYAIHVNYGSTGTIENNIIKNIESSKYLGLGIALQGSAEITDNYFENRVLPS